MSMISAERGSRVNCTLELDLFSRALGGALRQRALPFGLSCAGCCCKVLG